MDPLFLSLLQFFDLRRIPYRAAFPYASFVFNDELFRLHGRARAVTATRQLVFHSYSPVLAPAVRLSEVAAFLHGANRLLTLGNFDLDYASGLIRYKTAVSLAGVETPGAVHYHCFALFYANVSAMLRHLPALCRVIFEFEHAADALARLDARRCPEPAAWFPPSLLVPPTLPHN